MDNKLGILFGMIVFFLLLIPFQLDMWSSTVTTSQLNKVGGEIRQVVDASSEYSPEVQKAIKGAKDGYGVDIKLSSTNYKLGDTVEIKLTKASPTILGCEGKYPGKSGSTICGRLMKTQEQVKITNRKD